MAVTEYGKHMGELKRGEHRWDVYLEGQPDTSLGAVRGRIHFVSGQLHKVTGWIFLEWQEKDIQERFGEFSAGEVLHFVGGVWRHWCRFGRTGCAFSHRLQYFGGFFLRLCQGFFTPHPIPP